MKATKQQAEYRNRPKGNQRCSACSMFKPPDDCTKVLKGATGIKPQGWCKYFDRKGD
jgi:hypothetical protein